MERIIFIRRALAILVFTLVALCSMNSLAAGNESQGFLGIPFGTTHYELAIKIKEKSENDEVSYVEMWKPDNLIILKGFRLGTSAVEVYFHFNHDFRFYSFSFKSEGGYDLDPTVYEQGDYLTEVFKNKYGKPSQCFPKPTILEITSGYVRHLCKWGHKDLKIFTSFGIYKSRYYATAQVISKKMQSAMEAYKKKQEIKGAAEGAKSFKVKP